MRAIPNLPWTALLPTLGPSGKPGQLQLFLSGLADLGALELGSKLVGEQAVTELQPASDSEGRHSISQSTTYRPLVPVEELRRLKPGHGIVLYGHLRPTHV